MPLFRSLRPAQWSKNVFVLAPATFAGSLLDRGTVAASAIAFVAFCAAASAVYLFNDLRDREQDRRHPRKRLRPVASGAVGTVPAAATGVVLAVAALTAALTLNRETAILVGLYLLANLLYSLWLKEIVIVDVMVLASGYVIRVLVGATAVGVTVSAWLLLCTVFLSLFLGFSKRRHELVLLPDDAGEQRAVLDHYSPTFLDQMMNVVTASTLLSYALYTTADETVMRFGDYGLVWTVPFVLFGIFRYLYLIHKADNPKQRNPTELLLYDVPFLVNVGLYALAVFLIVYLPGPAQ
ncbi:MAG: decaprenyl-phosphate phosphoribosyltransferase [Acidobacteriota bacterium]|nr:decaprenyl-phosphate phosphoribosyltransferase [Acidobacteriota bacterium]